MSGHSKWATIKHKKGALDAKRGQLFTRIIREITIAAKMGGSDVDSNPRLRLAVQQAKDGNMPKDNIDRAVKKGAGELEGVSYEDVTYEGYGPGGVAIIVQASTDNKNRTAAEVRHIFSKYGGNMGEVGCVGWMFKKKGEIVIPAEGLEEDAVMEMALDAGAEDVDNEGEVFIVTTDWQEMLTIRETLEKKGLKIESAKFEMIAENTVKLDEQRATSLFKLINAMEECDDVNDVAANQEVDDEIMEKIM
ncbi:TPA: YebC/PmpR family DNA-binding transcriptional regulator [Candidatus Sumerlaeota bacterium]|nr:YebC/PmpR family DNA-binding transcriptional regulator [Candidatus Sumerlaeota bacterium]